MAKNINDRILQLQVDTKKLKIEIESLNKEGKSSQEIFEQLGDKFKVLVESSLQLADSSKRSFGQTKDLSTYRERLTKINTALSGISSSYKSVANAAQQASDAQVSELKRLQSLKEDIALKNIQLSKKENVDKLQDVVNYYDKVQSEYKEDTEEYLKLEKKKAQARINLQKEQDRILRGKRQRELEAAFDEETKKEQRVAAAQKKLRDGIAERNKARSKKVTDFFESQEKRRADFFERKEREKTAKLKAEEKKRTKAVEEEAKKRDFRGGFAGQLTPRAIGGALGSLTKYLGLYQLINAATRAFTEITIGSVKQSIEFEKQLANLGAVAGATAEEVDRLGKNALEVAGSTKFTAQEIVGLQTELSKLGFTADDVVASTQSIAFTAQALGAPLNAVAEQTGKVINQFDLLIEQAGFVGDVLVTAINNSALSFDSFGTAIQYVGPIAKNLGLSFEQTAGAMAVLADNGFTASRVGTGLRGIFTELGKTSADVEQSLKDLAEQNISLSEAVDLVGKRNAAQLITLLDNIDAIEEGNSKYYEQGRAIASAAKQADTFSGQVEILTSNFREFQIELGEAIAQSDLMLGVLDALFPKGAQTARSFKAINDIGFENFSKGADKVVDGADATTTALELLGIETEEYRKTLDNAVVSSGWEILTSLNPIGLVNTRDEAIATKNSVEGLVQQLNELSEAKTKDKFITEGQTIANNQYEDSVRELTDAFQDQINVNKQVDALNRQINDEIAEYQAIIDSGVKTERDAFGIRSIMVELTEEEKLKYEALVKALKGYQDQLTNITFTEKDLTDKRRREQSKSFREDLRRIKRETKDRIDAINERAKVETAVAETAEQRADIEIERTKLVSDEYKKQAAAIRDLSKEYDTQKEAIEEAAKSSDKLAKILTSEVFKDAESAFKEYEKEIKSYQEALDDGVMSQDTYNQSVADARKALVANISAFKELVGSTPELDTFFENLLRNYDSLSTYTKGANDDTKEIVDTFEEWIDQFKEEDWSKYVTEAVNATSDVLSEFNTTQLENTQNRLESELDAIDRRYKVEEDILKSSLDNQLITESQYRAKQIQLQKARLRDENDLEKQIFEAQKKQDRQEAIIDGAEAVALAYVEAFKQYAANPALALAVGSISAGIIGTQTSLRVAAINQRQFFPTKFEEGGMVSGPSHDQGGVPFTVQGRAGYEMEGGEFIVNKRATAMHRDLLERINSSYRTSPQIGRMKFAQGGIVSSQANESVDYLKAIAEATTSTAIGVSKPVRAYVSDKDLRTNANERRIRDRNDRL